MMMMTMRMLMMMMVMMMMMMIIYDEKYKNINTLIHGSMVYTKNTNNHHHDSLLWPSNQSNPSLYFHSCAVWPGQAMAIGLEFVC